MRRTLVLVAAALVFAPPSRAADCPVTVSRQEGPAPLAVTFTLGCEATSARWSFGGDGVSVTHTFGAGDFREQVEVTAPDGTVTTYTLPRVLAYRVTLRGPRSVAYAGTAVLHGRVHPASRGSVRVGRAVVPVRRGAFRARVRVTGAGAYVARFRLARSAPVRPVVRPRLDARVVGAPVIGGRAALDVRLRPAHAGAVRVVVAGRSHVLRRGHGTVALPTAAVRQVDARMTAIARRGWSAPRRALRVTVVHPSLGPGSRGASVRSLETRLRELRYALKGVDGLYAHDTYEAVLAFQKVNGLRRTGRVDASLWRRLAAAHIPRPRASGTYIEVDKSRQILLDVRDGEVQLALHVSTGATGNTPVGTWRVYRKNAGWDWVLWYPMYFLRGFAIHGYPSVPAHPASHGCVRVPMWIAPRLFTQHGYGTTIRVYP